MVVAWDGSWNWGWIDHTDTGDLGFGDTDSGACHWNRYQCHKYLRDGTAMTPLCWGIVIVVVVGGGFIAWACCAMSGICDEEDGRD